MRERVDIHEQCANRWSSILPLFGVDSRYLSGRQTGCPICREGKDRFRFDNKDGRGTWICNVCGAGNGMDLLLKTTGMGFAEACQSIRDRIGETTASAPPKRIDPERAIERAQTLWESGLPVGLDGHRDEVVEYLSGRGIEPPYPLRLRYHSACRINNHPAKQSLPAMLAAVSGPDGRLINVHRTYLENGQKARWIEPGETREASPRRMMAGPLPDGSAVRFGEPVDGILGVAEGIETALAVTQRFGKICWAALNATMLSKFVPPDGLRELHIFGDNDRGYAGQEAAYILARRASHMRGRPKIVAVHIPQRPGTDWADGLQKSVANPTKEAKAA